MRSFLIFLLRGYKRAISPFLGSHCRFYPTCSEYAIDAVEKKGVFQGLRMAAVRILKCHPFHPGGVDVVEL